MNSNENDNKKNKEYELKSIHILCFITFILFFFLFNDIVDYFKYGSNSYITNYNFVKNNYYKDDNNKDITIFINNKNNFFFVYKENDIHVSYSDLYENDFNYEIKNSYIIDKKSFKILFVDNKIFINKNKPEIILEPFDFYKKLLDKNIIIKNKIINELNKNIKSWENNE